MGRKAGAASSVNSSEKPSEKMGGELSPLNKPPSESPQLNKSEQITPRYIVQIVDTHSTLKVEYSATNYAELRNRFNRLYPAPENPPPFYLSDKPILISNPIGFAKEELLEPLYKILKSNGCAPYELKDFLAHHSGGYTRYIRLPWPRYINWLSYIYKEVLIKERSFIKNFKPFETIAAHYCNDDGFFDAENLRKNHKQGAIGGNAKTEITSLLRTIF